MYVHKFEIFLILGSFHEENFSGITIEVTVPKAKIILFQTGKGLITGTSTFISLNIIFIILNKQRILIRSVTTLISNLNYRIDVFQELPRRKNCKRF